MKREKKVRPSLKLIFIGIVALIAFAIFSYYISIASYRSHAEFTECNLGSTCVSDLECGQNGYCLKQGPPCMSPMGCPPFLKFLTTGKCACRFLRQGTFPTITSIPPPLPTIAPKHDSVALCFQATCSKGKCTCEISPSHTTPIIKCTRLICENNKCLCTYGGIPIPSISCTPRPSCLESRTEVPPCVMPTPVGGWCEAGPGESCGGFIVNPKKCISGYHCAPFYSNPRIADEGGTCVKD